jgi:hypothetical protein
VKTRTFSAHLCWLGPSPHDVSRGSWVLILQNPDLTYEDIKFLDFPRGTETPPTDDVEAELRRMGKLSARAGSPQGYTATWILTVPSETQ